MTSLANPRYRGIFPVVPTTFTESGELDLESQKRAGKAWEEHRFKQSVVPVKDINGLTLLAKDEHMRPQTSMQSLAQLQPSFVQIGEAGGFDAVALQAHPEIEFVNHVHHAGNSSGIVDGAAAVLIGSKTAGRRAGLKPRAKIKAFANIGSEPAIMLTGGAIAMGHPLGATGAMILGTVLDELERRALSTALVTLCIGAGMGTATIIERL